MSKIVVIGGTGFAGTAIVKEAAARGHEVVAVSRSAPAESVAGVRYVQGTADAAGDLLQGAAAVVGALSPRGDSAGTLVATYAALAHQAAAAGARLVVVGGFSSLRPAPGAPRFAESGDLPPGIEAEAREMNAVRASLEDAAPAQLDWLFVSPAAEFGGHLPRGTPHGTYRTGADVALFDARGRSAIEGADFARAIVDEIERAAHHRTQLHFAY